MKAQIRNLLDQNPRKRRSADHPAGSRLVVAVVDVARIVPVPRQKDWIYLPRRQVLGLDRS